MPKVLSISNGIDFITPGGRLFEKIMAICLADWKNWAISKWLGGFLMFQQIVAKDEETILERCLPKGGKGTSMAEICERILFSGFDVGFAFGLSFVETAPATVETVTDWFIHFHGDDTETHADLVLFMVDDSWLRPQSVP